MLTQQLSPQWIPYPPASPLPNTWDKEEKAWEGGSHHWKLNLSPPSALTIKQGRTSLSIIIIRKACFCSLVFMTLPQIMTLPQTYHVVGSSKQQKEFRMICFQLWSHLCRAATQFMGSRVKWKQVLKTARAERSTKCEALLSAGPCATAQVAYPWGQSCVYILALPSICWFKLAPVFCRFYKVKPQLVSTTRL